MCNTAAHITDRVLPSVPIRQWVLSLPFELRRLAAFRADVAAAVGRLFVESIAGELRREQEKDKGEHGAIVFVQRFGDSLNLNLHLHVLVLDGLFVFHTSLFAGGILVRCSTLRPVRIEAPASPSLEVYVERRSLDGFAALFALLSLVPACGGGGSASSNGGSTGGQTTGGGGSGGGTGGTGGATCTPSAELCDGMDNNCDGKVDEGCPCKQGDTQSCYPGEPATKDIGACKSGTQTCDINGKWGDCLGAVTPANEKCDGIDNDCDGVLENLPPLKCGVGACNVEVPACANGAPNTCVPGTPTIEVCDGLDNNCNQLVDETFPEQGMACNTGLLGACATGAMACVTNMGATAPTCVPKQMPGAEMCDGIDNDCNGTVDDNIAGTGADCATGEAGVCGPGTIQCQNGVVDCFSKVVASNETCDGLDNDCNGMVDDLPGAGTACSTGLLGVCATGIKGCLNGSLRCIQQVQAAGTDTCGDNLDNNCNGTVDEGCLNQFSGVATNIPIASLTGWTQCYLDTYANTGTALTTIQTQCNKAKLLLGCRATGASTLIVAAWAPRVDVLFDTLGGSIPHNANGVGWYYYGSASWGFAPQGDLISLNTCDTQASSIDPSGVDGNKRLCWHTASQVINGGWRCGTNDSLNASAAFQRIIYHAD